MNAHHNMRSADAHPDAELIALVDRWAACARECDELAEIIYPLELQYSDETRSLPEALFWREADGGFLSKSTFAHPYQSTGRLWFSHFSVDKIRALIASGYHSGYPTRTDRLEEIVAAHVEHERECAKIAERIGYAAVKRRDDLVHEQNKLLRKVIALTPAKTFEGIAAKARLFMWCIRMRSDNAQEIFDEAHGDIVERLKDDSPTDELLAVNVMNDFALYLATSHEGHKTEVQANA